MTSLSFRARELWIDAKAAAAVEFAMVLPFMLLLYIGGVELGNGMAINVKVTATTHSVG
jgi:Flp pilus assembly protein TadG